MLQKTPIARRYAKAFQHEDISIEDFGVLTDEIRAIVEAVKNDAAVQEFMNNPVYQRKQKISVMRHLVDKLGMSENTFSLLEILIRKNRINLLENVYDELVTINDKMNDQVRVEVTTAYEPSKDEITEIAESISRFFHKKVLVKRNIDPSVIGGFIVEGENKRIDMSVLGQVRKILERV